MDYNPQHSLLITYPEKGQCMLGVVVLLLPSSSKKPVYDTMTPKDLPWDVPQSSELQADQQPGQSGASGSHTGHDIGKQAGCRPSSPPLPSTHHPNLQYSPPSSLLLLRPLPAPISGDSPASDVSTGRSFGTGVTTISFPAAPSLSATVPGLQGSSSSQGPPAPPWWPQVVLQR